jgi:aldehyde dehydrogenase (NAD+)
MLKNIKSWAGPTIVDTPMMTGPGESYIIQEPYGVALLMGAWNVPTVTTLHPLMCAIAAGNCTLTKPSEHSRHFSNLLDTSMHKVIEGGTEVAKALLKERYDLIIFTGSPATAKHVARAAAEHLTPTILELGGKCPAIVDSDADIRNAALRI